MAVIHINFHDRDFITLIAAIEDQLAAWQLTSSVRIPADAIACAFDEICSEASGAEKRQLLIRLEDHFQKINSALQPV